MMEKGTEIMMEKGQRDWGMDQKEKCDRSCSPVGKSKVSDRLVAHHRIAKKLTIVSRHPKQRPFKVHPYIPHLDAIMMS